MTLVLFDIDGTLLNAHGLGRRTIEAALTAVSGRDVRASGVPFAGRTDPAIAADMLRAAGVPEADLTDLLRRGLERYVHAMEDQPLDGDIRLLQGVEPILDRLSDTPDMLLGLLTGNLEASAHAKLRGAGIDRYFAFGAFGSDHPDRYELPRIALDRARLYAGRSFEPAEAVIVGDTVHDVGCGRRAGMRTVAVATGPIQPEALRASGPDLLLDDLADPAPLYRFLGV